MLIKKLFLWNILLILALSLSLAVQAGEPDDYTSAEHYWADDISPAIETPPEKVFDGDDNYGNFTYYSGVTNWRIEDNLLKFTMTGTSCTLGWGYYNGSVQDLEDVQDMWEEQNHITIRIKGSSTGSKSLTTQLYGAGSTSNKPAATTTNFSGNSWNEVYMAQSTSGICFPTADGFQLTINGTSGESFEIDWVKLTQDRTEGYVRNEFTLPSGTVWRAIADVGAAPEYLWYGWNRITSKLYINGQEIRRNQAEYLYHTVSVDITDYIQTGTNCVGFFGHRVRYKPFCFFQCRIIMVDGTEVEWGTDDTAGVWKSSPTYSANWNTAGFDDSGWENVADSYGVAINTRGSSDQVTMAAYAGPIDIQNPDADKRNLFYEEGTDVLFDVYIPSGLETPTPNPSLKYYVRETASDGTEGTLLSSDTITNYTTVGNSLKYSIDLGDTLADGVYTISFELLRDTTQIAERPREPFVVITNHNPDPIEGAGYTEGLNFTLEDEIDFTDPYDSHAWKEYRAVSPATEVTSSHIETLPNGRQYREVTYDERGSFFTYRFEIDHPGDFYMVEIEYPDNDDRLIEISISHKAENEWDNSVCGIGAETGRTFYRTFGMNTLRAVFRATHDTPYSIDIANGETGIRSAAAGMKLYRIIGDLPVVRMGAERAFGIHTERTMYDSGIGNNFGMAKSHPNTGTLMSRYIQDLQWMKETFDHYVQYMKFAGQNMHIMGAYQYMQRNTPAMLINHTKSARMPHCYRAFLANVLEINDLDFYIGFEFCNFRGECDALSTNAQVAQGADTCWMVNANGQQNAVSTLSTNIQNWVVPDVQQKIKDHMDAYAMQYSQFSHFKGVHMESGPAGHPIGYWPTAFVLGHSTNTNYGDPLYFSMDDYTIDKFETDTSIDLGVTTTNEDRFQDRKDALNGNSTWRAAFYAWRCDEFTDLMTDMISELQYHDEDLQLLTDVMIEDNKFYEYYLDSGEDYADILERMGFDFTDLHAVDDLWMGRWTISFKESWRYSLQYSQSPYLWLNKYEPDIIDTYDTTNNRYVFVRASWDENQCASAGYSTSTINPILVTGSDWIMECYRIRIEPQPAGYQCREPIIAALITGEPELLVFGWTDLAINLGHEQKHRTFTKVYSQLPNEKFSPVLSTDEYDNLVIRELVSGPDTYFYMANPGYWPLEATVTLDENSTTTNLATNDTETLIANEGNYDLPVTLEPFGLAAYKVSSNTVDVVSYDNEEIPYREKEALEELYTNAYTTMQNSTVRSALSSTELTLLDGKVSAANTAITNGNYAEAWRNLNEIPAYLELNDVDWKSYGFYDQTNVTVPGAQQTGFSWAEDENVQPSGVTFGSDDAKLTNATIGQIYILAMQLAYNTADAAGNYTLQYKETGGTWLDVTSSSADWQSDSSQLLGNPTDLSDGDNISTSDFANAAPNGYTASTGEFCNDGTVAGGAYSADAYTEIWYTVKPTSNSAGKHYTFRIVKSSDTVNYDLYAEASVQAGAVTQINQSGYSWAEDENVQPSGVTFSGNDTALSAAEVGQTYILAVQLAYDGAASAGDYTLQYKQNGDPWVTITTSSTDWQANNSQLLGNPTDLSDGDNISTGDFANAAESGYTAATGEFCNDGTVAGGAYADGDYTEIWFAIEPQSAAEGKSYTFQIIKSGATFDYDLYPAASVAVEQINQTGYAWAEDADVAPGSLTFGADDTALTNATSGDTYIIALQLAYDGAESSGDYSLQYKETSSGTWTTVTTSTTEWQADSSQLLGNPTDLSDGDAISTSDFANAAEGGYSAANGEFCNDGTVTGAAYSDADYTEIWYAITPQSAAEGNSYEFRISKSGATFDYDILGSASVAVSTDQINQTGYSWAEDADVAPGSLTFGSDDEPLSNADSGTTYILAVQLAFDGAEAAGDYTLQYKENGGSWTTITSSSEDWQSDASQLLGNPTDLSDGDNISTSDFANAAEGGYSSASGEFCNDGTVTGGAYADEDYTEIWFAITPQSSAEGKSYTFQIIKSGSDFDYDVYASAAVGSAADDSVLYLKFNETSGSTAYDESDNNNDGTLNGDADWSTSGYLDGCITLDGSGDYVNCDNDSSLRFGSAITVTAWIKTSGTATYQGIAGKAASRSPASGFAFFLSSGQCRSYIFNSGTNSWSFGPTDLDDGAWHFVCFYSSASERGGWVDGTEYTTSALAYLAETANALIIGDAVGSFDGEIDELHVYDRVLSDSEVTALYNIGVTEKINQTGYSWAEDANVQPGSLTFGLDDTSLSDATSGDTYILAVQLAYDGAEAAGDYSLQFKETSSGDWTTITTSTAEWQADSSQLLGNPTDLSDGDAISTSDFANAAEGGYSSANGEFCNDGTVAGAAYSDGDYTEIWYAISPQSDSEGNTYEFRIIKSGADFDYDVLGSANVAVTAADQIYQTGFSWATDADVAPGSLSFDTDDTDLAEAEVDQIYILAMQLAFDGEEAAGDYELQYKETVSGSWTTITSSSSEWQSDASQLLGNPTDLNDGDNISTSDFANAGEGGYSAATGEFCNDGTVAGGVYSDAYYTEIWYAIKPTSSAEGLSYDFRVVKTGADFTYTVEAGATVLTMQINQTGYSWATDADVAPGSLSFGSDDTALSDAESGQIYILAMQLAFDGTEPAGGYTLQYKETSGSWTTITSSSSEWQSDSSQLLGNPTDLSDGDNISTSDFANAAESGYTAATGEFCNDGTVAGGAYSNNYSTEIWYAIKPTSSAEGKSYTFRIIKSGATFVYDVDASAEVATDVIPDCEMWLKLDETSGSTAYDETDNDNDGTLVGDADWDSSGYLNGCVTFDGSSDSINCGNDSSLQFGSAITVTAWIKTSSSATYLGIAHKAASRSPSSGFFFFLSGGQCRSYIINSGTNSWYFGPTGLNDGEWHFVAFYTSSTERGGWVDDTEYTTSALGYLAETGTNFIIGDAVGDFDGEIDDVRVFSRVLSDEEIASISGL
ncbi:MAG: hypothetical protein JXA52_03520 [Planctomycetes bacterium]|nr:hypothetical protein [Planctomycetota bacterium]